MKELENVYPLPGMLTAAEVDCLFKLGQFNQPDGVIVEIGSWKGKSTAALALGAAKAHNEFVYAVGPHKTLPEEGYFEDTAAAFLANIKRAGLEPGRADDDDVRGSGPRLAQAHPPTLDRPATTVTRQQGSIFPYGRPI